MTLCGRILRFSLSSYSIVLFQIRNDTNPTHSRAHVFTVYTMMENVYVFIFT